MSSNYHYPGKELALFEEARQWKRYLAEKIKPYISGTVLEVGAGISETTPYLLNSKVPCIRYFFSCWFTASRFFWHFLFAARCITA